jgi:hypothetical protein
LSHHTLPFLLRSAYIHPFMVRFALRKANKTFGTILAIL